MSELTQDELEAETKKVCAEVTELARRHLNKGTPAIAIAAGITTGLATYGLAVFDDKEHAQHHVEELVKTVFNEMTPQ